MPYDNAADAAADRQQQQELLAALGAGDRALRRDECGAWRITGSRGSIHTWGDGQTWVLWVGCRSAQHWTWTKKRLAFCTVTQDGDDEGCLRLHTLPPGKPKRSGRHSASASGSSTRQRRPSAA